MRIRKSCALSDSKWMTIPWTHHPKTPKDLLIDILVDLPGLCQAIDDLGLQTDAISQSELRTSLRERSLGMIGRIVSWKTTFSRPTMLSRPGEDLPEAISSHEIANSHLMTFFWAISLNVYRQILPLLDAVTVSARLNPDECCRRIIRSIPLLLHPSIGTFRQHLVPFPVISASAYLVDCKSLCLESERNWLALLLQRRELAAMRPFISSMNPQILQDVE